MVVAGLLLASAAAGSAAAQQAATVAGPETAVAGPDSTGTSAAAQALAELRQRRVAGRQELSQLRDRLGRLAIALQRLGRQPPVAALTAPGSPIDTARAMLLVRYFIAAAKTSMDRIDAELADLDYTRRAIEILQAHPHIIRYAGYRPARETNGATDATDVGAPLASQPSLNLEWPPAPAPTPGNAIAALPNERDGDRREVGPARPVKGALSFPTTGRIVERFGQANSSGLRARGVTVQTGVDAEVVAPYDGVVRYAGLFPGYGPMIIIEHDRRLHTLLAGLGRLDVDTGQRLVAGQTVGIMREDGAPDPGAARRLYIELREGGKKVDPLTWLSVERGSTDQ